MGIGTPTPLTDVDLSTEAVHLPGCEHPIHPKGGPMHRDGGEHYVRFHSPCGHYLPDRIKVVCGAFLASIRARGVRCLRCPPEAELFAFDEAVTDLGPVASFF